MRRHCVPHLELAALLASLVSTSCGLIDPSATDSATGGTTGETEGPSPVPWCLEAASAQVAEVIISEVRDNLVVQTSKVTLLDSRGLPIAEILSPDEPEFSQRDDFWRDATGNVVEETSDEGADGVIEAASTTTYDVQSRPVTKALDYNHDDRTDSVLVWDYEIENQVWQRYDQGNDGDWDAVEIKTFRSDGVLISHERDADADGTIDARKTYSYTEGGSLLELLQDHDADGTPESSEVHEYDGDGKLERSYYDREGDLIDTSETFQYDDEGQLERMETDSGQDGSVDYVTDFEYDDEGRLIRSTQSDVVRGGVSSTQENEYAEGPIPFRSTWDLQGDGLWEVRTTRASCE